MTSPRPETTDRTQLIEDKDKDKDQDKDQDQDQPKGVQLSATQVAAGALAAVSSAVVASFFGLAGTLIGAALASVISTVSAALYSNSLQKTNDKLRRARDQLTGRQARVEETEVAPAAAPATKVLPAHLDPRHAPARGSRPRWIKVAAYAAGVFVIAMGIITGIELIGQRPVSALVGDTETSRTTTIGAVTNASSSSQLEQDEDPSSPSSPTTSAPATGTGAPTTGADEESTSDDDTSGSDETGSATPTRTSQAEPTTSSQPTRSSGSSSEQGSSRDSSSEDDTSPAAEAEPTP